MKKAIQTGRITARQIIEKLVDLFREMANYQQFLTCSSSIHNECTIVHLEIEKKLINTVEKNKTQDNGGLRSWSLPEYLYFGFHFP